MARGNVFKDPKRLDEMLHYRKSGYSYHQLAEYYNTDHTTILYHCRKAGLVKDISEKDGKKMIQMVNAGKKIESVAKQFGLLATVVSSYCSRAGVKHKIIKSKAPKLVLKIPVPKTRKKRVLIRTEKVVKKRPKSTRPGWIQNTDGTWRCAGKPIEQLRKEQIKKKKQEDVKKRINMLIY